MTDPWDYDWDDWVEPAYPMTGPAFDWAGILYITIHYPGAPGVLPLTFESEQAEIRAEQRMYLRKNPPYSLGYNAKVFQDGTRWKLRGDVLRCAANGSQATNLPGFAIQIRVANDETPTGELIEAVRSIVAWAREKAGRHLAINGHRDLKATACPGEKAYALIQQGVFEPREAPVVVEPPVVVTPPLPVPEDNMAKRTLFIPTDCDAQFLGWADDDGNAIELVWVTKAVADAHRSVGVVIRDQLSFGGFTNCVLLGRLPVGDTRHEWTGAEFHQWIPGAA